MGLEVFDAALAKTRQLSLSKRLSRRFAAWRWPPGVGACDPAARLRAATATGLRGRKPSARNISFCRVFSPLAIYRT